MANASKSSAGGTVRIPRAAESSAGLASPLESARQCPRSHRLGTGEAAGIPAGSRLVAAWSPGRPHRRKVPIHVIAVAQKQVLSPETELSAEMRQTDTFSDTDLSELHRRVRFGIEELSESGPVLTRFKFKPKLKQPSSSSHSRGQARTSSKEKQALLKAALSSTMPDSCPQPNSQIRTSAAATRSIRAADPTESTALREQAQFDSGALSPRFADRVSTSTRT